MDKFPDTVSPVPFNGRTVPCMPKTREDGAD